MAAPHDLFWYRDSFAKAGIVQPQEPVVLAASTNVVGNAFMNVAVQRPLPAAAIDMPQLLHGLTPWWIHHEPLKHC
jgi:hypothetical protein